MKRKYFNGGGGQYSLANCYFYGIGTTKDEEKTFQWYLKYAEEGNSYSPTSLVNNQIYFAHPYFPFQLISNTSEIFSLQLLYSNTKMKLKKKTKDDEKAFQLYI